MYRWVSIMIFISLLTAPCPWAPDDCEMILVQQVFLPLVVTGAVATPTPAITPTPRLPAPGITPRAER